MSAVGGLDNVWGARQVVEIPSGFRESEFPSEATVAGNLEKAPPPGALSSRAAASGSERLELS